jgi:hypothetical protein
MLAATMTLVGGSHVTPLTLKLTKSDANTGRQFCERLTSTVCADSPCGEQCTKCNGRSTSTDSEPRSDELMPLVAFSNSHSSTDIKAPCCGDGELCGGKPNACSHRASSDDGGSITLPSIADALDHVARNDSEMESRDEDTMGADEAWRTLKASHLFCTLAFRGRAADYQELLVGSSKCPVRVAEYARRRCGPPHKVLRTARRAVASAT